MTKYQTCFVCLKRELYHRFINSIKSVTTKTVRQIHMWVLTLCHLKFTTQIKFGYVLFYCKFLDCISFYISMQPSFF